MSLLTVRQAVRSDLAQLEPGDLVLAACSGGPDSLALTSALVLEAPALAIRVGVVTVDHQLQEGSDIRAKNLIAAIADAGVAPAEVLTVDVGSKGGPEAAARDARYAAINAAADRLGAQAIYLAHSAGDQAESVLLGLARGSGTRSLSGMAPVAGRFRRPLLTIPREVLREAGLANHFGIPPWEDPHNLDPRYLRVRARERVLPLLESELGPGIETALVRSAKQLREDADALDHLAGALYSEIVSEAGLDAVALGREPRALRARVILEFIRNQGVEPLTADHVDRIDALISDWSGQGEIALPGGRQLKRADGYLRLA
jgi:tRNA(Ile)-lysidine synthase